MTKKARYFMIGSGKEEPESQNTPLSNISDSEIEKLYNRMIKLDPNYKQFKGSKRDYVYNVYIRLKMFGDVSSIFMNKKKVGGSDTDTDTAPPKTPTPPEPLSVEKERALDIFSRPNIEDEDALSTADVLKSEIEEKTREEIIEGNYGDMLHRVVIEASTTNTRVIRRDLLFGTIKDIIEQDIYINPVKPEEIGYMIDVFETFKRKCDKQLLENKDLYLESDETVSMTKLRDIARKILTITQYPFIADFTHIHGRSTAERRVFYGYSKGQTFMTLEQGKQGEFLIRSNKPLLDRIGFSSEQFNLGEFLFDLSTLDQDIMDLQEVRVKEEVRYVHAAEIKTFGAQRAYPHFQLTKSIFMANALACITDDDYSKTIDGVRLDRDRLDKHRIPLFVNVLDTNSYSNVVETRSAIPLTIEYDSISLIEKLDEIPYSVSVTDDDGEIKLRVTSVLDALKAVDIGRVFKMDDAGQRIVSRKERVKSADDEVYAVFRQVCKMLIDKYKGAPFFPKCSGSGMFGGGMSGGADSDDEDDDEEEVDPIDSDLKTLIKAKAKTIVDEISLFIDNPSVSVDDKRELLSKYICLPKVMKISFGNRDIKFKNSKTIKDCITEVHINDPRFVNEKVKIKGETVNFMKAFKTDPNQKNLVRLLKSYSTDPTIFETVYPEESRTTIPAGSKYPSTYFTEPEGFDIITTEAYKEPTGEKAPNPFKDIEKAKTSAIRNYIEAGVLLNKNFISFVRNKLGIDEDSFVKIKSGGLNTLEKDFTTWSKPFIEAIEGATDITSIVKPSITNIRDDFFAFYINKHMDTILQPPSKLKKIANEGAYILPDEPDLPSKWSLKDIQDFWKQWVTLNIGARGKVGKMVPEDFVSWMYNTGVYEGRKPYMREPTKVFDSSDQGTVVRPFVAAYDKYLSLDRSPSELKEKNKARIERLADIDDMTEEQNEELKQRKVINQFYTSEIELNDLLTTYTIQHAPNIEMDKLFGDAYLMILRPITSITSHDTTTLNEMISTIKSMLRDLPVVPQTEQRKTIQELFDAQERAIKELDQKDKDLLNMLETMEVVEVDDSQPSAAAHSSMAGKEDDEEEFESSSRIPQLIEDSMLRGGPRKGRDYFFVPASSSSKSK